MTHIVVRPASGLDELDDRLSPEVAVWVRELRTLWQATGLSLSRFAAGNPIDKGTLSRYLNGKRVPRDQWLLDRLLAIQAEKGREVADQVREHLTRLQLEALKVAHPHEYRVRQISDDLETAVIGKREAERYARFLEEQLVDRVRQIEELNHHHDKLRVAWDADRAEIARLRDEVADLTRRLEHARQRAAAADEDCRHLEELLNRLETGSLNYSEATFETVILADPTTVAALLNSLRKLRADAQAALLAERAAAEVPLTNTSAVAELLRVMKLRAQAGVLAERAAAEVPLNDPKAVLELLRAMRHLKLRAQAGVLAERAAAEVPLNDPDAVAGLLRAMKPVGQAHALAERAATHFSLDSPRTVARMLDHLRGLAFEAQAVALAERAATEFPLNQPREIAAIVQNLRDLSFHAQASALAERAATEFSLTDPYTVARMLNHLRLLALHGEVSVLAERAITQLHLKKPSSVAMMLDHLRSLGLHAQAFALAERAATNVPINDLNSVAALLESLRKLGADAQAAVLAERQAQRPRRERINRPRPGKRTRIRL